MMCSNRSYEQAILLGLASNNSFSLLNYMRAWQTLTCKILPLGRVHANPKISKNTLVKKYIDLTFLYRQKRANICSFLRKSEGLAAMECFFFPVKIQNAFSNAFKMFKNHIN